MGTTRCHVLWWWILSSVHDAVWFLSYNVKSSSKERKNKRQKAETNQKKMLFNLNEKYNKKIKIKNHCRSSKLNKRNFCIFIFPFTKRNEPKNEQKRFFFFLER